MRLTLRTLLAFMDDVLEPADREQIAKKLESSDFANDLIHRTKDTMRRLRLSAPQVVGTGIGLDPNTVAEYLDNTLPPDGVADFERICLESDVHLAEVASCHHVLTMVLGEPAEVDPASRQRMYLIPTNAAQQKNIRIEAAHPAPAAAGVFVTSTVMPAATAPPNSVTTATIGTHATGIPDYLRASAWSAYRTPLVALAATLLLAITALLTFGLRGWFGGEGELATAGTGHEPIVPRAPGTEDMHRVPGRGSAAQSLATAEQANRPSADPEVSGSMSEGEAAADGLAAIPSGTNEAHTSIQDTDRVAGGEASSQPAGTGGSPLQPLTPGFGGFEAASEEGDRYATGVPTVLPPSESPNDDAVAPYRVADADRTSVADTPPMPPIGSPPQVPSDDAQPLSPDADRGDDTRMASIAGTTAVETADAAPANTTGNLADDDEAELAIDAIAELGTYLDAKNVLLRYDPSAGAWFRMLPRTTVGVGDKLLALPAFYPRITLKSGMHLKLAGGTLLSLGVANSDAGAGAASARQMSAVDVAFGQVVIVNTANEEHELQLALGETAATIRLVPGATLAIEIVRSYIPGRDPRQSPAPLVAHLYAPDGNVQWEDANGSRTIQAPGQWDVAAGVVSDVSKPESFPDWIDSEPVGQRSEQLWGVPVVEQSLDATRPVENQLLELYQGSRRREVKSLVARSSVYVGLFVPFVEALRDSDQSAMWKTHVETLRAAMALGPESADKIYQTLVEQRGETAARDLYEMLCGYDQDRIGRTPEQVAAGPIPRLIDWLEEDSLDYRVLAVQDLWEVCNKRFLTNPAGSPAERTRGVRVWRERLKSGELNAKLE